MHVVSTIGLLALLLAPTSANVLRHDSDAGRSSDRRICLAPPDKPVEATAVHEPRDTRHLAGIKLTRFGYPAGDDVTLVLDEPARQKAGAISVRVLDPGGGKVLASPRLDPGASEQKLWRIPPATTGLHTVRLDLPGGITRDLPFNVWTGIPKAGACAHRGDRAVAPENTLPAIRSAVAKGAHQIEVDVQTSKDGHLVIMHDPTVDRTTNGKGNVADLTFEHLRALDAGSWKGPRFKGAKIPTFREVIETVPPRILLNCHLKRAPGVAAKATRLILEMHRLDQCFLACNADQAKEARAVCPSIKICNMTKQRGPESDYPDRTIAMKAAFIQIIGWSDSMPAVVDKLHKHGVTVNYFGTNEADMMRRLIDSGVNYPLTDNLDLLLRVLAEYGVKPANAEE